MKQIKVCIGTDDKKNIRVRLSLIAGEGMPPLYHSIALSPGDSVGNIRSLVEAHLAMPYEDSKIPGAPWPKIPDEEWAEVEQIVSILHTPERIAKRVSEDQKRFTNAAQAVRTK